MMSMDDQNIPNRKGIYGQHPMLEEFVKTVKSHSRGITATELREELDLSKTKFDKISTQAQALGMIDTEGGGMGIGVRLYHTQNKQLLFEQGKDQMDKESILEEVEEALDELDDLENAKEVKFAIQRVDQ